MYYIAKLPNLLLAVLLEPNKELEKPVDVYNILDIKSLREEEMDPELKESMLRICLSVSTCHIKFEYESLEEAKKKFEEVTEEDFKVIEIKIEMPEELSVLAGHELGLFVYHKYIKEKFYIKRENKLIFPDHIEMLCGSFIRGMLQPLLSNHSAEEVYNAITTDEKFKEEIKEELDL